MPVSKGSGRRPRRWAQLSMKSSVFGPFQVGVRVHHCDIVRQLSAIRVDDVLQHVS